MKTTKRLFSWLIVLAMVFAMVPVFDLPTFAATEAGEEAAEPVRFPSDVESYEAECPVCETTVEWVPYNGENYSEASGVVLTATKHHHLYLTEDKTYESGKYFLAAYANVCFNLNGYDVTASEGSKSAFMTSRTFNFIDTFGGSVVTGYANSASTGAALHANGGNASSVYNVYGGTWTKLAADTMSSIVKIGANGGTINLYDGTVIDASGTEVKNNNTGAAVGLSGSLKFEDKEVVNEETGETTTEKVKVGTNFATFNMYGGEIKGGTGVSGGAVQVGVYSTTNFDCAVFNLYGGKVSGGEARDIMKADGVTVQAYGAGGNFSVQYGGTLNVAGGTIADGYVASNGTGNNWGGNIRAWQGNVNISGGLIYGGNGGKNLTGANVSVYSDASGRAAGRGKLTISGGTVVGDIATSTNKPDTLTISGAPKIVTSLEIDGETVSAVSGGLCVAANAGLDISKLEPEADIAVSTVTAGQFFTAADANAAKVAACFKSVDGKLQGKAEGDKIYLTDAPVVGGPNLPQAATAAILAASKVKNDDASIDAHIAAGTCPMCGATNVTWTKGDAVIPNSNKVSNTKKHYYFDAEKTTTSNFVQMVKLDGVDSANNTICVALKSTAKITCTKYRVQVGGTNNTLNIMGTGSLIADQGSIDGDLGLFQMEGGTLNLYGGTYLHKNYKRLSDSAAIYAVVRMSSASVKVNIYNDTKIGPAELTPTEPSQNIYMGNGTLNIYGGTIRNGIAYVKNMSGNISVTKGTVNIYGGTILGGTYLQNEDGSVADSSINDVKGAIRMAAGTLNIYGGNITGGVSKNGGNGANVYISGGGTMNLMGGTISGGRSTSYGGNIGGWTGTINISGTALIENGYAPNGGGNLYVPDSKMIVNITGGTIRGGESAAGGNIYVNKNSNGGSVNISGGVIEGGVSTKKDNGGGNIFATATGVLTLTGGVIKDGKGTGAGSCGGNIFSQNDLTIGSGVVVSGGEAVNGGNIFAANNKTLTIESGAQILDGKASYGGNIFANSGAIVSAGTIKGGQAKLHGGNISIGGGGSFTMNGGVLANGWITEATGGAHWGGNIRSWNGKITINDGLVYGGGGAVSNIAANNIGAYGDSETTRPELTINGGTIVGDVATSAIATKENAETGELETTFSGTKVTLTGAPKIVTSLEIDGETVKATNTGLYMANGIVADISGLSADAQIVIYSPYNGRELTVACDNAAALTNVFTAYDDVRYYIELGEDNVFYHVSKPIAIMSSEAEAVWYKDVEEAVADYYADGGFAAGKYLRVGTHEVTVTLAGDAYLNTAGYDVTVAGTGMLYGFDSSNDDYNGYSFVTLAEDAEVQVAAETKLLANRYIAVEEDGKWGFHRLAMWISGATLRTSNPGMYYKAAYQCDSVLRNAVGTYGVALSLQDMPGLDFAEASDVKYTQYDGEDFAAAANGSLVNTNSGSVVGILKTKNTQARNAENLSRVIYANSYITFNINGGEHKVISNSNSVGMTVEDEGFKGTAYSLADILLAVNENWENYSDEDKATVQQFILNWVPYVPGELVTELTSKLTNIFPSEA